MTENLFTALSTQYDCLTKTEKKIADFILKKPEELICISIPDLAALLGISQGSIHNFSKKLGCAGFAAFKVQIAGALKDYRRSLSYSENNDPSMKEYLKQRIDQCTQNMVKTYELNTEEELQKAADLILAAKRIQLHGVYHSGIAAQDFCYQLIQLGIPATFIGDQLISAVSATMLDKESLVIAISASGRTKEILDTVAFAKEKGAAVLVITSQRFSPLARLADITLLTAAGKNIATGHFNESRANQLFMIDSLCTHLHHRTHSDDRDYEHQLSKIVSSHNVCD